MTIKPVADIYLITYEDGSPYKSTRDAKEAIDAIGAGFKVEEFVGIEILRALMLQVAESLSNRDELPLDYLQGQKDGLEWAAQLAEANHPHTGDWLYDDPVELAKAIRKGPDMPELKSVPADADDNFYSWFCREWEQNYQPNRYSLSAKKHLGAIAESAWFACRAAMLQGKAELVTAHPELTVWYGSMPETNGKTNWTAMLHRKGHHPWEGITIDRSEYPERVRYEADRMRHLIGELTDEPDILAYDADAHSGYAEPVSQRDELPYDPQIAAYEKIMEQAIPDGYALVPVEPTEDMIVAGFESRPDESFSKSEEWEAYQRMSGCEQAAHRAKLCWAAMLKAAPQQE